MFTSVTTLKCAGLHDRACENRIAGSVCVFHRLACLKIFSLPPHTMPSPFIYISNSSTYNNEKYFAFSLVMRFRKSCEKLLLASSWLFVLLQGKISATTGWIFLTFNIYFSKSLPRKFKFDYNLTMVMDTLQDGLYTAIQISG